MAEPVEEEDAFPGRGVLLAVVGGAVAAAMVIAVVVGLWFAPFDLITVFGEEASGTTASAIAEAPSTRVGVDPSLGAPDPDRPEPDAPDAAPPDPEPPVEPIPAADDADGAALDPATYDPDAFTWSDTGGATAPLPWPEPKPRTTPSSSRRSQGKGDRPTRMFSRPVRFVSSGGPADVYVDGRRRGETPLTLTLDAGTHDVKFVSAEATVQEAISVGMDKADEFRFDARGKRVTPIFR